MSWKQERNETQYTQPEAHRELPTLKDALIWLVIGAASIGIWALVIWLGKILLQGGMR